MKQKLLLAIFGLLLLSLNAISQNGYIYIHNKSINEANSTDFTCNITGGPTSISQFVLNDKPDYIQVGDIGASHSTSTGTTGNGELWAISNGSAAYGSSYGVSAITGTVYHRAAASSQWSAITMPSGVTANNIDGAGPGACVYTSTVGDVYYYNGTSTFKIFCGNGGSPSGSLGNANDVSFGYTANRTAILSSNGNIYIFNPSGTGAGSYAANNTNAAGTTASNTNWTAITVSGVSGLNTATRIDMNYAGDKVVYTATGPAFVYFNANNSGSATTVTLNNTGVTTVNGSTGALSGTNRPTDIAYDDNGVIYCEANISVTNCSSTFGTPIIFRWVSGTTFTEEGAGRQLSRLTGSAAGQMWGVSDYGFANTIWTRATDNSSTVVWLDDERVRTAAGVTNGNSIMIPVTAGTYTFTETIPNSNYDLGRYNIYDPTNNTSGSVGTNTVTINVAAGEVVNIELINEYLVPKSISLTCTTQTLQSFDAGTGSGQFGTGSYGTAVEGTAYHYISSSSPQDGDYYLVKSTVTSGGSQNWYTGGDVLSDNTGNGGYFLLVNASYAYDEFYRQRVTNLVPGLSYTITFYMANALTCNPIKPNIQYGLQDLNGNYLPPQTTGDISATGWQKQTYTFTATTSTADLYLKNINIGGLGNDVALDDIALNPVIKPLDDITVSPAVKPNICIGTSYTFGNSQSGGVWTVSPSSIATINAITGVASGKAAGTAAITYTYTNQVGCVSSKSTGIIVSAPPSDISVTDKYGGSICKSQVDSLFTSASGGTTPYTYLWDASPSSGSGLNTGDINTQNIAVAPTTAGTYTYTSTITDAVGCSVSGSVNLVVSSHTAPTLSVSSTNVCLGSAVSLTSTPSGGSGSYTYKWVGVTPNNGLGTVTTQNTTANPTAAGTYLFRDTLNDGFCKVVATTTATVYAKPTVTVNAPAGNQQLCSGGTLTLTSTVTAGSSSTYTYAWTGSRVSGLDLAGSPGLQNPTTTASLVIKPTVILATVLTPDVYNYVLTVTDGNGCTTNNNANVSVYLGAGNPPTVNITSPTTAQSLCSGATMSLTASASAGSGTSISSYAWTGPGGYTSSSLSPGTITPTATGTYVLTVTEANGCKGSAETQTITVKPAPSVAVSRYASKLCSNTVDSVYALASGGTVPYTYAWTSSSSSGGFTIAQPSNDTTAVTGGNGGTTYTLTMTVTDSKACTVTGSTTVTKTSSSGPTVSSLAGADTLCINSASASFTSSVSGGTSPYTYAWTASPSSGITVTSPTSSSTTVTPTAAGIYQLFLKVTDNNGCAAAQVSTGNQTVFSALTVTTASSSPGFCGSSGSLNLVAVASNGSGTYSNYAWTTSVITSPGTTTVSPTSSTTTGTTTATISGATVNTSKFQYTATVTDNAGCTASDASDVLVVGSTPTITSATATLASPCLGNSFTLSGAFSGGTSPWYYTWTPPSNSTITTTSDTVYSSPFTTTATATAAGNYAFGLVLIDKNNCTVTSSTAIKTIYDNPVITLAADKTSVCANPSTTINLTGTLSTGTTSPYTYAWSGSGVTNNTSSITTTAVPTTSGNEQLIITDANSCKDTATVAITVDQATPNALGQNCGTRSGVGYVQLYEQNGVSWTWATLSGGQRYYTDNTLSPLTDSATSHLQGPYVIKTGTYTVTITNSAGCIGSGTVVISSTTCGTVLPVSLLDFTAQKAKDYVALNWGTASEVNSDYFAVERSVNGFNWQTIGTVKAHGNSTIRQDYKYLDENPYMGINYYRLRQVDADGHFAYSEIRTVDFTNKWLVHIYPNPATDYLVLEINSEKEDKGSISIQTSLGSTVFIKEQTLNKGRNLIRLNQIQPLAQGSYIITFATKDNIYRSKFVKGGK